MKKYLREHPWQIIEEGFNPDLHESSESLFSLANGHMGQRANFEEAYSGSSLQGNYIAGIFYPDKTRVGWWKNGYPEYFAKVLNAPSWIGLNIKINQKTLNLSKMNIHNFKRILDMREGVLYRSFEAEFESGEIIKVSTERFLSLFRREIGGLKYSFQLLRGEGTCEVEFFLDGDVRNQDANYDDKFWDPVGAEAEGFYGVLTSRTKKSGYVVSTGISNRVLKDDIEIGDTPQTIVKDDWIGQTYNLELKEKESISLVKIASVLTSRDHLTGELPELCLESCKKATSIGYEGLKKEHLKAWEKKWEMSDVVIEGDLASQQGIRFSIFQLNQTYSGHDPRLNIGPKGFTGEKYGGGTYWDTEAYCLPFYLNTAEPEVARNLLLYRYHQLGKAIENAVGLGFSKGAALFPMVTMNGEECHNEWEITFEEIHRNGAIVFAIYNYIRHTGDKKYMEDFGLEVIIAVARFWYQRVHYSSEKALFVIHGVTGPNEYENNVNNNWYTNYIAAWTLRYATENIELLRKNNPLRFRELVGKLNLQFHEETSSWKDIANKLFLPEDKKTGIFLQQEGYLDKELLLADDLKAGERPLNQNWSWDRILRSCFIKQADVLQGLYFFEDHFDMDTHRRNFEFYEPRTVHESSLSPGVHVVLASRLGMKEKAFELYTQSSRLDLDDYNNEIHEGCHITSMAGTWLAVVEGFGGMRVAGGTLHFNPSLPDSWGSLRFIIRFRNRTIRIHIGVGETVFELLDGDDIRVFSEGKEVLLKS